MDHHKEPLPQLAGDLFLTDAGLETDIIFNHGIEIREFASHTLLDSKAGRKAMRHYYRGFLSLARQQKTGFILDSPTWRAQSHFREALGCSEAELADANRRAVSFVANLRKEFATNDKPVVLNGVVGPRGDAYAPESAITASEAQEYHKQQLAWLAMTDVDMVSAITFNQSSEAIGFVKAASSVGLPAVVSFTVETDGALPSGQPLGEAIDEVDAATKRAAAYFMINCAHPEHFRHVLTDGGWLLRIRGMRCNASRLSHQELDEAEQLDAGNPQELGQLYRELVGIMPWVNIFGGCCGSDLRHVTEIANAVRRRARREPEQVA